jgi:tetratricopeptide (TPR) repeat protein
MAEVSESQSGPQPDNAAPAVDPTVAIAMELRKRRRGRPEPEFDGFLRDQRRLINLQAEHLHEQRELVLSRLRWARFSDRLKALLQTLTILVGVAFAGAVAVMAWQAREDHGVSIAAFSVPPDLAQRGVTGQVVASQLLDGLAALQRKTVTARPASTYANDWGGDIKVEIPETGVSIGELNRYLREWLGSETRVAGEVVRTPTGIAVTARAGNAPGRRFEGPEVDLDRLVGRAAEAVYAETQPYRYAVWRASEGQTDQAMAAYAQLALSGAPEDRAWAYAGWATLLQQKGDSRGAEQKSGRAIALDPSIMPVYPIRGTSLVYLGRTEDMVGLARTQLRAVESGRAAGIAPDAMGPERAYLQDALLGKYGAGDYARAYLAERRMGERLSYEGVGGYSYRASAAGDLIALHEPSRALREAGNSRVRDAGGRAVDSIGWLAAMELQDWPAVLTGGRMQGPFGSADQGAAAHVATALLGLGRITEAEAMIAAMPDDCTDCLELRGDLAAARGDRRGVNAAYGAATGRGEIPLRDLDWGRALLRLGDPDAAIVKLKRAHQLGPRFADPLELWAEALIRKQDFAGAADKFAMADKQAPRWGRNHLMWGEALMLSGRYAEARRQYEIASGLDLPKPDRAALEVLLARTAKGPLHG